MTMFPSHPPQDHADLRSHLLPGRGLLPHHRVPHPYVYETSVSRGFWSFDDAFYHEVSDAIEAVLTPPARVLVLGAGRGRMALDLMVRYGPGIEVDCISKENLLFTPSTLKLAFEDMPEDAAPMLPHLDKLHARHRVHDLEHGIPKDMHASYEVIILSQFTLSYLHNKMQLIEDLRRGLKVGGRAFAHLCGLYTDSLLETDFNAVGDEFHFEHALYKDQPGSCFGNMAGFPALRITRSNPEDLALPFTLIKEDAEDILGSVTSFYQLSGALEPPEYFRQ